MKIFKLILIILFLALAYNYINKSKTKNTYTPVITEPSENRDNATGRRLFTNSVATTQTTDLDQYNEQN